MESLSGFDISDVCRHCYYGLAACPDTDTLAWTCRAGLVHVVTPMRSLMTTFIMGVNGPCAPCARGCMSPDAIKFNDYVKFGASSVIAFTQDPSHYLLVPEISRARTHVFDLVAQTKIGVVFEEERVHAITTAPRLLALAVEKGVQLYSGAGVEWHLSRSVDLSGLGGRLGSVKLSMDGTMLGVLHPHTLGLFMVSLAARTIYRVPASIKFSNMMSLDMDMGTSTEGQGFLGLRQGTVVRVSTRHAVSVDDIPRVEDVVEVLNLGDTGFTASALLYVDGLGLVVTFPDGNIRAYSM
jgi:hypothetical protein